jgi:thioredoxin
MSFANFHHSMKTLVVLVLLAAGCGRDSSPVSGTTSLIVADPIQLTDETFQREVIESELPVLVDMWAPWCQPCIAMKPTIRELSSELSGKAKVAELNIEQNPFIKEKYNVDKYPMLLIFADGIEVQRLVGIQGREELLEALSDHLASSYRQRRQR